MINYNKVSNKMKEEFFEFFSIFLKGMSKVQIKFIVTLAFGILATKTVLLSKISESLNEKTSKKKIIERLSRNLADFKGYDNLNNNYLNYISPEVTKDTVFVMDTTDYNKQYAKAMENIGRFKDASAKGEVVVNGYACEEIIMLNGVKHPISVQSEVYSNRDENQNKIPGIKKDVIKKVLKNNVDAFGTNGIYTQDRGYDDHELFEYQAELGITFICRVKKNRIVTTKNGKKVKITKVIKNSKKRCQITIYLKGKKVKVSASHAVVLINGKKYNLIACYGLKDETDALNHDNDTDPFLLLTNMEIKSKDDIYKVVLTYAKRWKIEEFFRVKKDEYDFENFRVRKLNAIKTLNLIMNITLAFVAKLSDKAPEKQNELVEEVIIIADGLKKKVRFWMYRISEGTKKLFSKISNNLLDSFFVWQKREKPRIKQLDFFAI